MNKKLLCAVVTGALPLSAGAIPTISGDDPWIVPYVVKDTNRTTVVTLINGDQNAPGGKGDVHIQYWTKSTTAANTAACEPSSVYVPMTENDVMTFDTAGLLGYPLFGDTSNPAPLGTAISYAAPRHGYLIADPGDGQGMLAGVFWLELDLANGGAHGDKGFGPVKDSEFDNALSANVMLRTYSGGPAAVNFWPSSVASTVFTVTPLGTDMLNRENNQAVMQVINTAAVQGAYDRNENGVDGTVPQTVRCVGRLTPAQLMPGVVANAAWAAQGGWGWLANKGDGNFGNDPQGGTNSGDLDAIVYQVDSATAAGRFISSATRITTGTGAGGI